MTGNDDGGRPDLMTDRPHSARAYDYYLGGKDNYAADRAMADAAEALFPGARITARANRAFMHRAARLLVETGLRQFLDIGTGIPTEPNLHQVVQAAAPESRVVYVDNDPIVLAHAAALMVGDPRGRTAYLEADARDPESILTSATVRDTLDLARPVGLSMISLLQFLDDEPAQRLVTSLVEAVAPGSYLALSHTTADGHGAHLAPAVAKYRDDGITLNLRSRDQIVELFLHGVEILDPGIVLSHHWRPDADPFLVSDADNVQYGVVARKPSR